MPKQPHSPIASHRALQHSASSSPLMKKKQPESNNVPSVTPKPKRPPPPVPPPRYRKKSATYVQLEENSSEYPIENGKQLDTLSKEADQVLTENSGEKKQENNDNDKDSEQLPCLYEVPISQQNTLETITEGNNPSAPVAPPRKRKQDSNSPRVAPKPKVSLGKIPKVASAPFLYNGDSSAIAKRKTSDVMASVRPPNYSEEQLEKCSVSDNKCYLCHVSILQFCYN